MFQPQCLPILIGSLPLENHAEATRIILEYTPEIPLWPQLPKCPREGMIRQFLTGFPGLIDKGERYWIDTETSTFAEEMAAYYEEYMEVEADSTRLKDSRFALGSDTAPGFFTLLETLATSPTRPLTLKGQVTGPITTGIGVKDQNDRSIFYDDNLRDMLIKQVTLKACWQVEKLRTLSDSVPPILFIDEPGIVSFGSSAFTGITGEMVSEAMADVIAGIKARDALAGIHICANGDWAPALSSNADIISFDAYFYFDNFILYKEQLSGFLSRGGILAWGIVPTSDPLVVAEETVDSLYSKWEQQLHTLTSFGRTEQQLMNQTLIAPSCGTGSLSPELALKVLSLTSNLSQKIRSGSSGSQTTP